MSSRYGVWTCGTRQSDSVVDSVDTVVCSRKLDEVSKPTGFEGSSGVSEDDVNSAESPRAESASTEFSGKEGERRPMLPEVKEWEVVEVEVEVAE